VNVLFLDYIKEEIGGGHFVLARLANYFQKNPYLEVTPIVFLNNYNRFIDRFIDGKVAIYEYKIPNKILSLDRNITKFKAFMHSWFLIVFWFRFSKILIQYCKKNEIDIIHVNSMRVFILSSISSIFFKKTKVVFHLHDALISQEKGGNVNQLASKLVVFCIKYFADKVIAVSKFVKDSVLERGIKKHLEKKVHVIHNGVELCFSKNSDSSIDKKRIKNEIKLLSFGVLSERKGFHLSIEAVHLLKQHYSMNIEYKILGDGHYKPKLIDLTKKFGLQKEVEFLGFKKDVHPYIKQADLIIIPSVWQDPLPLTVIESMQDQKVVIATNVGGIPEMIDDGINGFLVPLENAPEEIAKKVAHFAAHPELMEKVAKKAAQRVKEYFNIERMAREIAQIYLSVIC